MQYSYWMKRMAQVYAEAKQQLPEVSEEEWNRRDTILSKAGFLPWERVYLNLHSMQHKAPLLMISDRSQLKQRAVAGHWTRKAYEGAVRLDYFEHHWFFRNGNYSPFRMMEYYKQMADIEECYPDKTKRKKKKYGNLKNATA